MNSPILFKSENTLGPLELQIMKIIWKKEKVSVRDIVDILENKKSLAYTTVMTVMDNLFKKGFLKREKNQKSFIYSQTITENKIIDFSVYNAIEDLSHDYGKLKILSSAIKVSIVPPTQTIPFSLGVFTTILVFILGYATVDLIDNLRFFGSLDFLGLTISEPANYLNNIQLMAFFESLPMINILTVLVSFILVIILLKKINKLNPKRRLA